MTALLVRVAAAADAAVAAAAGVDRIEVDMAGHDLSREAVQAIRAAFPGVVRLRFAGKPDAALWASFGALADEVALPYRDLGPEPGGARGQQSGPGPDTPRRVAIVTPADDPVAALGAVRSVADMVVLDAGGERRLIDALAISELDAFARACRAAELPFGLAGGLEPPDVVRLLLLRPDLLAFDGALRHAHRLDAGLDSAAVEAVRALIPRAQDADAAAPCDAATATDCIFVRDFLTHLSIGAYQAERGSRQRVRFSVAADVQRAARAPNDMRDVFSYDIIIETIRVLAGRAHVVFVEELAEELAAVLLGYPALVAVSVTVEKLDVIEGAVGITIRRDRRNAGRP